MTEDRRAHERLNEMDFHLKQHTADILRIEHALLENTGLAKKIEENTAKMVIIMEAGNSLITLVIFLAKVGAALLVIYAVVQAFLLHLRGG